MTIFVGKLAKTKDARVSIYWNGNITTNGNIPATLSFYTADIPTTYTVLIEGILENGEYVHQTIAIARTKREENIKSMYLKQYSMENAK
ncbi:MAG: hypothetical protein JWR18_1322 [Segetibacter sp.]|nr:hypothetical protein [Segetibacter sp.]